MPSMMKEVHGCASERKDQAFTPHGSKVHRREGRKGTGFPVNASSIMHPCAGHPDNSNSIGSGEELQMKT